MKQTLLFRGIYEFEDPAGTLIAARTPHSGSADLYAGTAVVVRPNQCALLIYKGKIADILFEGTHSIKTENVPIITRLANWRFGFKSPLRCEIWFFSSQVYPARRWGTSQPIIHDFKELDAVPVRAYGNFNVVLKDPKKFYLTLIGSRTSFDISEFEEFVQGQILEFLPQALASVASLRKLNQSQNAVSESLQTLVNRVLKKYGIEVVELQVLSLLPSQEILKALDTKAAMNLIGDKREYLLYQAANSLNELQGGSSGTNDPMQMMLGLMLGKNIDVADYKAKEQIRQLAPSEKAQKSPTTRPAKKKLKKKAQAKTAKRPASRLKGPRFCTACGTRAGRDHRFCSACGKELK